MASLENLLIVSSPCCMVLAPSVPSLAELLLVLSTMARIWISLIRFWEVSSSRDSAIRMFISSSPKGLDTRSSHVHGMHCESVGGELAKGFKLAAVALPRKRKAGVLDVFAILFFLLKFPSLRQKLPFPRPFLWCPTCKTRALVGRLCKG